MPIRVKRNFVCPKCGKKITVVMNDAIMPRDAEFMNNPLCKICRIKSKISKT